MQESRILDKSADSRTLVSEPATAGSLAPREVDEFAETVLQSVQTLSLELADVAGNVDSVFNRVSTQADY